MTEKPALTEKQLKRGLVVRDLEAITGAIAPLIIEYVQREMAPLHARIRVLESIPKFEDAGPWRDGKAYTPGKGVSHEGGFWICQSATMARPGTNNEWRLAVKRAGR